jgi:circadian clock protein KaiB
MNRNVPFRFRLYVAGDAYNSAQALSNLTTLCQIHLPDRHQIEIIDVLTDPKRAHSDGILLTPTLVKLGPAPVRRIVGTLNQHEIVLRALGLETVAA